MVTLGDVGAPCPPGHAEAGGEEDVVEVPLVGVPQAVVRFLHGAERRGLGASVRAAVAASAPLVRMVRQRQATVLGRDLLRLQPRNEPSVPLSSRGAQKERARWSGQAPRAAWDSMVLLSAIRVPRDLGRDQRGSLLGLWEGEPRRASNREERGIGAAREIQRYRLRDRDLLGDLHGILSGLGFSLDLPGFSLDSLGIQSCGLSKGVQGEAKGKGGVPCWLGRS